MLVGGLKTSGLVAPRAGAWIETPTPLSYTSYMSVAPHAGAWIETAGFASDKK